jgi:hypothetical protein
MKVGKGGKGMIDFGENVEIAIKKFVITATQNPIDT